MNTESVKIIDLEVLDTLHDAIGDSLADIIKLYLIGTPNDLAQMQQAIESKDFTTVGRLAHSLKSSSANLGAMQTSALAAELEHIIAAGGEDPEIIMLAINKVILSFDQTHIMFDKYTQ